MAKYVASGLLIICTTILQAYSYERCTTGYPFVYCKTGYCCKIKYNWHCTGSTFSLSDCDSFSQLRPTTKAPQTNIIVPTASAASGFVMLCIIVGLIVCCVRKSRRQTKYEGQVIATVQSPGMYPMNNMQGYPGGQLPYGVQPNMMIPATTIQGGQGNGKKKSSTKEMMKMAKTAHGVMRTASMLSGLGDIGGMEE